MEERSQPQHHQTRQEDHYKPVNIRSSKCWKVYVAGAIAATKHWTHITHYIMITFHLQIAICYRSSALNHLIHVTCQVYQSFEVVDKHPFWWYNLASSNQRKNDPFTVLGQSQGLQWWLASLLTCDWLPCFFVGGMHLTNCLIGGDIPVSMVCHNMIWMFIPKGSV